MKPPATDQSACVPFRRTGDGLRVCLIHKPGSGDWWGIPKGFIDPGCTSREAALQEAHEEVGVRGRIVGEAVGRYTYHKWGRDLSVEVWLMEVTDQDDDWLEAGFRERHWLQPRAALERVAGRPFAEVFTRALRSL